MNIKFGDCLDAVSKSIELNKLRMAGEFKSRDGEVFKIVGAIEIEEIDFFSSIVLKKNINVLDIGVGKGVSTALFASMENVNKVVGIDPYQSSEHNNSLIKLCDLLNIAKEKIILVESKSIEAKPSLNDLDLKFDLILVDGYHSFDSTLVDFLIGHEFLNDGGLIAFHDCFYKQKQKVLSFIIKNRDYEIVNQYPKCRRQVFVRTLRFFWHLFKYRTNPIDGIRFLNPFFTDSSLVVLRKNSGMEPKYWEFKGL
ncbi:MAG TPA: hypothetical protein DDW41_02725 [Candidatus Andersenbacteria bacterium]|nr:hypothetical protein [Candidatus Andersenbacteria bacterium]